jgi:chromate transporter
MDATTNQTREADAGHGISFTEAFRAWLRVALLSFGGPAGQIAVMHRLRVDEKNWTGLGMVGYGGACHRAGPCADPLA